MSLTQYTVTSLHVVPRQQAVDRFVCIFADTDEAKHLHYQLRFKVFCDETGFEDPAAFPEKAERDRYDYHAKHFIIWDRQKRQYAGAMRLVSASATKLPCENIVGAPLEGLDTRRPRTVEFSRLCILDEYRHTMKSSTWGPYAPKGQDAEGSGWVAFEQEDNDVLLRLLWASFEWRPEVQYCYFIVTGALARVLSRLGIPLTQVGEKVKHRGVRTPFCYDVEEALAGMRQAVPEFAAMTERSAPYISYSDFIDRNLDDESLAPLPIPPYHAVNHHVMRAHGALRALR